MLQIMGDVVSNLLHVENRQAWNGMDKVENCYQIHFRVYVQLMEQKLFFGTRSPQLSLKLMNQLP